MKNHEGYHDPTAGKAIRRAYRAKRTPSHLPDWGVVGVPGVTSKMILIKFKTVILV